MKQTCSECGFAPQAAQLNCASQRDQLLARDFEQPALYWSSHRIAVDAYCLQHSSYVASAKSLAAHLCGLCIAFEQSNDSSLLRHFQQWLSSNPAIAKPALPCFRGTLNIGHVSSTSDPVEFKSGVEAWARSAWDAYRDLHPIARHWLALAQQDQRRSKKNQR